MVWLDFQFDRIFDLIYNLKDAACLFCAEQGLARRARTRKKQMFYVILCAARGGCSSFFWGGCRGGVWICARRKTF
jgi:hypothetical protein